MSTPQGETDIQQPSRRKRAGRVVFFIGLALLAVIIVFSLSVSIVSSYSGAEIPIANYSSITLLIFVLGLLLILAGLIAAILPEGPSKDGIWVMKMSPFAGTN
jgi:hypothetical protein